MNRSFTKKWHRIAGCLLILFTGLILTGCKVAHMALPQGLQGGSTELAVEGRGLAIFSKKFTIGPYQVTDVHRGWTRGKGYSIGGYSSSEAKQKYEFSITKPGSPSWEVNCATEADWSKLKSKGFLGGTMSIDFSSSQQLVCNMQKEGARKPSTLVMAQSANEKELKGIMTDGTTQIDISVTHKLDSTSLKMGDPTGYIFHIGGSPVGATEIINKGTVWLNSSVKPDVRSSLVATSAVLLLYQDIQKIGQNKR
jgi:hypothetical protein